MENNTFAFTDPKSSGSSVQGSDASIKTIDYSAWDYQGQKFLLSQIAERNYGEKYNNFVESDFGIVLMEFMAGLGDQLSYKLDMYLNEIFLSSCMLPKSVYRHAKNYGYEITPRTSAVMDFSIALQSTYGGDIFIPAGHEITTNGVDGSVIYICLYSKDSEGNINYNDDIVIPKDALSITNVVGIEGKRQVKTFNGLDKQGQRLVLPVNNFVDSQLSVKVDGAEWKRTESLYLHGTEPVYQVSVDEKTNRYYVTCGDGINGLTFPAGSLVDVSFKIGGGTVGNISAGSTMINKTISANNGTGDSIIVTITNTSAGHGGAEQESVEQIKRNLPAWIKRQERVITLDDYTLAALKFYRSDVGRVARARAYLRHAGGAANIIDVYMLEFGGGTSLVSPSESLSKAFIESIEPYKDCTHSVCVKSGKVMNLDFSITITAPQSLSSSKSVIESDLRQAMDGYFKLDNWNFGVPVDSILIERYLSTVPSLRDCTISVLMNCDVDKSVIYRSYDTKHFEIVRIGTVAVSSKFVQTAGVGKVAW